MTNKISSSPLPIVLNHEGNLELAFNSMPFWEGVQKKPGVRKILPFSLMATNEGPISQGTPEKVITEIVDAYQSSEYAFITPPPGASEWANSLGETRVATVKRVVGDSFPKNILEIGGGSTWVAKNLYTQYRPNSYLIIDPSIRDTDENIDIIHEYFPNEQIKACYYDLIIGFSVLEHVVEPLSFLRSIRRQLTPAGKVILIYPDCERQLIQGDLNVLVHEHLSYFTALSSRSLAIEAGFKVLELSSENDIFTLVLEVSTSDHLFLGCNESEIIISSARSFESVFSNTAYKIRKLLNENQPVGFHGATNGLNIFLFISGLGAYSNIRIYDGDVSKQGFFLPTCSSSILSPLHESYRENALIVISAMSFFDQIKSFAINKALIDPARLLPLIAN